MVRCIPVVVSLVAAAAGCSRGEGASPRPESLILATTTSTSDSGLLDALLPRFEAESGIHTKVVAVGSGQALMLGRRGEADALLVHSPAAEEQLMAEGFGESRAAVMSNRFVVVGPEEDPAGIESAGSGPAALAAIAKASAPFYSRGDDSGTHAREKSLWAEAKLVPSGDWYHETGQGMGATLSLASEKRGYTLSDIGTYLALRKNLDLAVLVDGGDALLNPYHVIVVARKGRPGVRVEAARAFARFMTSPETQEAIGRFGVDHVGEPLFHPTAAADRAH